MIECSAVIAGIRDADGGIVEANETRGEIRGWCLCLEIVRGEKCSKNSDDEYLPSEHGRLLADW